MVTKNDILTDNKSFYTIVVTLLAITSFCMGKYYEHPVREKSDNVIYKYLVYDTTFQSRKYTDQYVSNFNRIFKIISKDNRHGWRSYGKLYDVYYYKEEVDIVDTWSEVKYYEQEGYYSLRRTRMINSSLNYLLSIKIFVLGLLLVVIIRETVLYNLLKKLIQSIKKR